MYDELKAQSHCKKTFANGMWKASKAGQPPPGTNLDTGPWANVVEVLMEQLNPGTPPHLPKALLGQILGITPHRNDAGHKPRTIEALIRRDTTSRTRFENAIDILLELIRASKSLRV